MKKASLIVVMVVLAASASVSRGDTFGSGANQFEIHFVTIFGDAGSAEGTDIGGGRPFVDPEYIYRIGTYEITNDQWDKFKAEYGAVNGTPWTAYNWEPYWTGINVPTNCVSWLEAAQFVNYLNISSCYQAAYKFTGEQGTEDYALSTWSQVEAWQGSNLYRHKDAHYFLPTENEWVKAAYWNGSYLQYYTTTDGAFPVEDVDSNYGYQSGNQPWVVGTGSQELNGTYDMTGNVWEWMENPSSNENYGTDSSRRTRGGSYSITGEHLFISSNTNMGYYPHDESINAGFRVASVSELTECPSADLSGDCFVGIADLAILAQQWCSGLQAN